MLKMLRNMELDDCTACIPCVKGGLIRVEVVLANTGINMNRVLTI